MEKIKSIAKQLGQSILMFLIFFFCCITIKDFKIYNVSNSFLFLPIIYYTVFNYKRSYMKIDIWNTIFSFLLSTIFLLGREYGYCNAFSENLNIKSGMLCIAQFSIVFIILYAFISILQNKEMSSKQSLKCNIFQKILNENKKAELFSIVFVCWLPYIIISYAHYFSWDAADQLAQYMHIPTALIASVMPLNRAQYITTHHSVLYTYLLGWFSKIINVNIGLYIFELLQTVFIIYSFVCLLFFVNEHLKENKGVSYLCMFICFFPMNPKFFAYIVKDNLFFALIVLCLIELYKFVNDEKYSMAKLIVFIVLSILLRNNAVFAFLPYFCILFIWKQNRKQTVTLIGCVLITICVSNFVYGMLQITKGSQAEMLSLPFQQVARVVKLYDKEFTGKEKNTINQVIDYDNLAELYRPTISDPVKSTFNEKKPSNEELVDFFKLWWKILLRHPLTCIEATVNNQIGNFYPFYTEDMFYMTYARGKISIDEHGNYTYLRDWCFDLSEIGYTYQDQLAKPAFGVDVAYTIFSQLPIVGTFTNGALYVVLWLYTLLIAIRKKEKNHILFLLFFAFYLCTILLGPCGAEKHFRYIYPFYGCMPIFYMMLSKCEK